MNNRDTGNIGHRTNKRQRKTKGQSRMNNTETLATFDTQDTGQIYVRENRRGNQEWTIQRDWQHLAHKTKTNKTKTTKTQVKK